jgi:hypothetical protein
MAFFRVVVSACCPTTDLNVEGLYFRADTIKLSIKFSFFLSSANILKSSRSFSTKYFFIKNYPFQIFRTFVNQFRTINKSIIYEFQIVFCQNFKADKIGIVQ